MPMPNPALREITLELGGFYCRTERIAATDKPAPSKGGEAFEELHRTGFNGNAIAARSDVRMATERCDEWKLLGLRRNGNEDLMAHANGSLLLGSGHQCKCYGDAEGAAAAFRELDSDGNPKYDGQRHVGPKEVLPGVMVALERAELKNRDTRPNVSAAAAFVKGTVSDRATFAGIDSIPVTRKEAIAAGTGRPTPEFDEAVYGVVKEVVHSEIRQATEENREPLLSVLDADHLRLINNRTVDENGVAESAFWSTDPKYDLDELDGIEKANDKIMSMVSRAVGVFKT